MIQIALLFASAAFAGWIAVSLSVLGHMIRRARQQPQGAEPVALEDQPGWRHDPALARRVRLWMGMTAATIVLAMLAFATLTWF